jgi:hypothetical protein
MILISMKEGITRERMRGQERRASKRDHRGLVRCEFFKTKFLKHD